MSSHASTYEHSGSDCCGIQIDFYEICGHTLTLTDHAVSCTSSSFLTPPPTAYLRPQSGPSTSSRPKLHIQPELTAIPELKLNCPDLHRYIRFFPSSCSCNTPLEAGLYLSTPTRSDPHHSTIPKPIIFERRMHWLHQHSLESTKAKSTRALEMSQSLSQRRALEIRLRVPWMRRVFIFDPAGQVGDFFGPVDVEKLSATEKSCKICTEVVTKEKSRRLPCGCVLDLGCVVEWMKDRKDCPVCGRGFRLVSVVSVSGEVGRGGVSWEDDKWSDFI